MKAVVCIKQVPDTQELRVDFQTGEIKREGVPLIINPFDEYAIEEAVRLKEEHGGEVVVVTVGPPQAEEALRTALAMGCDNAVLLSDPTFLKSDTWATALILNAALNKLSSYDLLFFGKQTFDGDTGMVGARVATLAGLPLISFVAKIVSVDFAGKTITAERLLEGGRETVTSPLPAAVAVVKEINEPRYPSLMGLRKAKKVEIPKWDAATLGLTPEVVGDAGSFLKVEKISPPPSRAAGVTIECEAAEAVARIAATLAEKGFA